MSEERAYMLKSQKVEWATPQELFDRYNKIYQFDWDVAASHENTKVPDKYTTLEGTFHFGVKIFDADGLTANWGKNRCWMNPPYGLELGRWVAKAASEAQGGATVVALLPSRTDVKWFHTHVYKKPYVHIEFLKGRLKFGGATSGAPFPSMIVVFT